MSDVEKIIAEALADGSYGDGTDPVDWETPTEELISALRAAGYEVAKPEWEYAGVWDLTQTSGDRYLFDCLPAEVVRRRKAGMWQPVEEEA